MTQHFVYLLIDPRNDEIFYVGQGTKTRYADHSQEALDWDRAGRPPLRVHGDKSPHERRAKLIRILDILKEDPKRPPIIEFLRADLSRPQADLVETVAIDLIGLQNLTNQVPGPAGSRRMRATLYEILSQAQDKTLTRAAVIVPTQGVRGTYNAHGGMLEADPATALENAESRWGVDADMREALAARASRGAPTLLIGIQSGDSLPRAKGLVMGVWEIDSCVYEGPRLNNRYQGKGKDRVVVGTFETDGYRFVVKERSSPELEALRKQLVWHRLFDAKGVKVKTQPGPTYVNWSSGDRG
jgi:hypothetical protein